MAFIEARLTRGFSVNAAKIEAAIANKIQDRLIWNLLRKQRRDNLAGRISPGSRNFPTLSLYQPCAAHRSVLRRRPAAPPSDARAGRRSRRPLSAPPRLRVAPNQPVASKHPPVRLVAEAPPADASPIQG